MRILQEMMGLSNNQEIIHFPAKLIIDGVTFGELNTRKTRLRYEHEGLSCTKLRKVKVIYALAIRHGKTS